MPKVSIITVNLNNLDGLKKTAESVLSQSFKDFEFIILDGNSKDGSKEYINDIKKDLTLWVSEPDAGIYDAMNKGIKMAKGDYICFLNSGDIFFDSHTLENLGREKDDNVGIYYGDMIWNEKRRRRLIKVPAYLTYPYLLVHGLNHQSCFIKRSLFDEIFYYHEEFKIIADWEFLMYAIFIAKVPTKHIGITVCIYDATGISSIEKNQKAIYADRRIVINRHFPLFNFNSDEIKILTEKRGQQFLYIKQHKIAYRILKWCISLILLFLPKFNLKSS